MSKAPIKAERIHHETISPQEWDRFVMLSPQGMIYLKYHFLSIVSPEWEAIRVWKGGHLHAVMPIEVKRKYGLHYALQPIFSQYGGICFRPFEAKRSRVYESKKQYVKAIIEQIPKEIRLFEIQFSPSFDYPLPFVWSGYRVRPRFTYMIDLEQPLEKIRKEFGAPTRGYIRKAEKLGIGVEEIKDIEAVIRIFRSAKGKSLSGVKEIAYQRLAQLYHHFAGNGECFLLGGKNKSGELVAGILFFRYKENLIHFFGSSRDKWKSSGIMSLLIWEAIKRNHHQHSVFDFEGSMIESIERFFRGFGSVPVPYYSISKRAGMLSFLVKS